MKYCDNCADVRKLPKSTRTHVQVRCEFCGIEKSCTDTASEASVATSLGYDLPRTAEQWLEDALGFYQVTHIHSCVREALKVLKR